MSVVRFRPWPPFSHRQCASVDGVSTCNASVIHTQPTHLLLATRCGACQMTQPPHTTSYFDNERHADGKKSAQSKTTFCKFLTALSPAQPQCIYLRDGELIVYRRSRSLLYQCRYKLADGKWIRRTTGKAASTPLLVPAISTTRLGNLISLSSSITIVGH